MEMKGKRLNYLSSLFISLFILIIIFSIIGIVLHNPPPDLNTPTYRKPVIYLYPTEKTTLTVTLEIDGTMLISEPTYGDGWNIEVTPDGLINGFYKYLFYEAEVTTTIIPNEGWCVKFENLEFWMDDILNRLGFNENEINDFKEYWLEELPFSNYYEIHMLEEKFLEEHLKLVISPKPNVIIRAMFTFKPLEKEISTIKPDLITPTREGFVMVEWGGILYSL